MPYCTVHPSRPKKGKAAADGVLEPVKLYYRTYGEGDCKIMMIMGVAAAHGAWHHQIRPLTGTDIANEESDEEDDGAESTAESWSSSDGLMLRPAEGACGECSTASMEDASRQGSGESWRAMSDLGPRLMATGADAPKPQLPRLRRVDSEEDDGCSHVDVNMQRPHVFMQPPRVFESLGECNDERDSAEQMARSGGEKSKGSGDGSGVGTGGAKRGELTGRQVCVFDNRGVGRSSFPLDPKNYRTDVMARDALAIADQLGWTRFHVIGHSMGGMIACKLAALAPMRVKSLALISTSSGGFDLLPRMDLRVFKLLSKMLQAHTAEERALVDLETHFSESFLSEHVDGHPRRKHLYEEYVKTLSAKGCLQPKHAQSGQISACWHHNLTQGDVHHIAESNIPTSVIHGSDDVVAHVSLGQRLSRKLGGMARFVELYGGHMIIREKAQEVNAALTDLLSAAEQGMRGRAWVAADKKREDLEFEFGNAKAFSCGRLVSC